MVKSGWDEKAKELMARGVSWDCAYALAAIERASSLQAIHYNSSLTQKDADAGRAEADSFFIQRKKKK